jgi:peptidoglycan/xylan/chitin deacetylase (PgdA/CDA1 family)
VLAAKSVVLTFDDAVKSHRTFVGPLLKELGFRATFFVTHAWMSDTANFMSWSDIAELHQMGFEIGNHSWTHADFSQPRNAARLAGELALVEYELARVKVPKPTSFAWPGNSFGPEAVAAVLTRGYSMARRGGMPEVEYGRAETVGPLFDPERRHRMLIPTTADAYPKWTFEHFQSVVSNAPAGRAVVLQFHGVPDVAHPWVHTEPDLFRSCMQYLKDQGFHTLAMRDLGESTGEPDDPLLYHRNPLRPVEKLRPPVEVEATRRRLGYWGAVMRRHGYEEHEREMVAGKVEIPAAPEEAGSILPYPGGRHTRIGFLDGAVSPMRGTKASVFLPWDRQSYVVVDLPEAIISARGILFLAHSHIPTVWDAQNRVIENVDWSEAPGGGLRSEWTMPDKLGFGASILPVAGGADMELWIHNGTADPLLRLRAQVCVLLRGARGFDEQTNANKQLGKSRAEAVGGPRSQAHRISVEWEPVNRVWANPPCPCMHSDPGFPDCAPGETVRSRGRLRFD